MQQSKLVQEPTQVLKVTDLSGQDSEFVDQLRSQLRNVSVDLQWATPSLDDFILGQEILLGSDITLLASGLCVDVWPLISRSSVSAHFSHYFDCVTHSRGHLWGESLFTQGFRQSFQRLRHNRSWGQSVIFLGEDSRISPMIEVLATFGFKDFALFNGGRELERAHVLAQRLVGIKIHKVQSKDLVQSAKEYSLCFICSSQYSDNVLADISYFHFLSVKSLVLKLKEFSNFPFDEVKALGTEVVETQDILIFQQQLVEKKIMIIAQNNS
jgi:hypothetical protein